MKNKNELKWFVYRENLNARKIEAYNIFQHFKFQEDVKKLKKKKLPKEEFAKLLKSDLMYYFWSKCEHEIVLTSFPPHVSLEEVEKINSEQRKFELEHGHKPCLSYVTPTVAEKIDVYSQVMLNWDVFLDYVYE